MESLTARTVRQIQTRIAEDRLVPGDKLGTLAGLGQSFGVSRTVMREAVAALAAEGLLEARHGVGVFLAPPAAGALGGEAFRAADRAPDRAADRVAENSAPQPPGAQSAAPIATMTQFSGSFMDMLEVRMAFEVHAAGLAAQRRSLAQEAEIWSCLREFEAARADDTLLDDLDFAFHQAIIQATNNAAFIEFFALMGRRILPAATFSRALHPALITDSYIDHTLTEHRAICVTISDGDVVGAREAMRAHLTRAHDRYRGILYQSR